MTPSEKKKKTGKQTKQQLTCSMFQILVFIGFLRTTGSTMIEKTATKTFFTHSLRIILPQEFTAVNKI